MEDLIYVIAIGMSVAILVVFFVMASQLGKIHRNIEDIRKIAIRYAKKDEIDLSK